MGIVFGSHSNAQADENRNVEQNKTNSEIIYISSTMPSWLAIRKETPLDLMFVNASPSECWSTNDEEGVKKKVKLVFENKGYRIATEDEQKLVRINFYVGAWQAGEEACIGTIKFTVSIKDSVIHSNQGFEITSDYWPVIVDNNSVDIQSKEKMKHILAQKILGHGKEFLSDIKSKQQTILSEIQKSLNDNDKAKAFWSSYKLD